MLTISMGRVSRKRSASASATAVLPQAVGPVSTQRGSSARASSCGVVCMVRSGCVGGQAMPLHAAQGCPGGGGTSPGQGQRHRVQGAGPARQGGPPRQQRAHEEGGGGQHEAREGRGGTGLRREGDRKS